MVSECVCVYLYNVVQFLSICSCACMHVHLHVCLCEHACLWGPVGINANLFERTLFLFKDQPLMYCWTEYEYKYGLGKAERRGKKKKGKGGWMRIEIAKDLFSDTSVTRPALCYSQSHLIGHFLALTKWWWEHTTRSTGVTTKTVLEEDRKKSFHLPPVMHNICQPISLKGEMYALLY